MKLGTREQKHILGNREYQNQRNTFREHWNMGKTLLGARKHGPPPPPPPRRPSLADCGFTVFILINAVSNKRSSRFQFLGPEQRLNFSHVFSYNHYCVHGNSFSYSTILTIRERETRTLPCQEPINGLLTFLNVKEGIRVVFD